MAKLVDAPDLGSGVLRRVGSSPITRTMRQKRNSQNREFLFPVLRIDNTCSNRSQDAWRSHALRVAVGKCCQLRQTESTMRAAKGHAKRRASGAAWVAVGKCCQL